MVIKQLSLAGTLLLAAVLPGGCGEDAPPTLSEPPLRPVKTIRVIPGGQQNIINLPGVIDASRKADLGFRVGGKISKINIKEGDDAGEGQVLAMLDQADYRIKLDAARAEYERARSEFERSKELVEEGAISQSEFDAAQAQYSAANSQLEGAERNMAFTALRSPFSGTIAKRYVQQHEDVSPNQPVFTLFDLRRLHVRIDVPESKMIRIKRDRERRPLFAVFDAFPDEQYPLEVFEVAARPDEKTQSYAVTLSMPAPRDRNILPGMSVSVRAEAAGLTGNDAIVLPANAVLEDERGRYVYTVIGEADGTGVIKRIAVVIGDLVEQGIEVTGGLEGGEHVVTAGVTMVTDGMKVRAPSE